jgi:hypothetical protein
MCASVNNIHANVSNTRTINLERLVSLLVATVFLFTTSTYSVKLRTLYCLQTLKNFATLTLCFVLCNRID